MDEGGVGERRRPLGRADPHDLTGTVLAGHHQPLRVWVLCLYFMGLNLSNRQIAEELDLNGSDVQVMTEQLRSGLVAKVPAARLDGEVEIDEIYLVAGHKGQPAAVAQGSLIHTDEYDIYARLSVWGYRHKTVCHGRGEYARDEDGDGFCEIHVNTMEGTWSLLRSWLRPHRGISQEKLPLYLGFFEFVHNARRRGKALLGALVAALVV